MIVYRLHPAELGTSGLFLTPEGAKASAQRQLDKWLEDSNEEEEYSYPIATSVTWYFDVDGFGNPAECATYCRDHWSQPTKTGMAARRFPEHDRFILREVEVGD